MPSYDEIGRTYTSTRAADPRIAAAIWAALGDAPTVVNVGAGAGAYEPADRVVTAVEPSEVMIAQRPPGGASVVRAQAEALPFAAASFDASMAILSDHHWADRPAGLREMRRVARRRVVLFNANPAEAERFWLTSDYLPEFLHLIPERYREAGAWAAELEALFAPWRVELRSVPIPHDCRDGFYGAYWRRPEAFLDPDVRRGISVFPRLPNSVVERAMRRLAEDLASGAWRRRHRDLLETDALELGYYVIVAEPRNG